MTPTRRLASLASLARRALAAAAALAPALAPALAAAQPVPEALVPRSPAPAGFIVDGGPVLSPAARGALNARIAEVQRTTGGDVGVLILRDLAGRAPADMGVAVYRAWKIGAVDTIGSPRRDLGALLLIVPKELAPSGRGECWITTGLGAEGVLTDGRAARVCREAVIPALRRRDHAAAVAAGVEAIAEAFAQATADAEQAEAEGAPDGGFPDSAGAEPITDADAALLPPLFTLPDDGRPWWVPPLLGGVALLGGVGAVRGAWRRRPRRCPAGHGRMTRLAEDADDAALADVQRLEERLRSVDYDVWACARCTTRTVVAYRRWLTLYAKCPACAARTLWTKTRTVSPATTSSTGLAEVTSDCRHCTWHDVTTRTIPRRSSSSGSGSGGSSGGFGGSGRTSGGGGGSSY